MDKVEKNARSLHGNFIYDITWKARMTDKKWLWGIVLFVSIVQLTLLPVLLAVSVHAAMIYKYGTAYGMTYFLALMVLASPLLCAVFSKSAAFGVLSQFISVAGDMGRVGQATYSLPVKVIAKFCFLLSGVLALITSVSIWYVRKNDIKSLSVTELDVLGSALSNGKVFWKQTREVYDEMSLRYAGRFQQYEDTRQIAISFGMACKWMLRDPKGTMTQRTQRIAMIRDICKEYPDLPEEVLIRYREVTGENYRYAG